MEKSLRYRIKISTSVKGVKTWECTCDGEGWTEAEMLRHSDSLTHQLEQRYPPVSGKEEGK